MGTEDAIVFSTGHQANVGTLGNAARPGRHGRRRLRRPRLAARRRADSRAKLRAFRHNKLDKLEQTLEKAVADGGGILVVVDGVFSMEGDIAPLREITALCKRYGARLMVDEATPSACSARAARAPPSCSASRPTSTCGWAPSPSRSPRAAASSPATPRSSSSSRCRAAAFLFTASGVPAAVGAALAALRVIRTAEGRELLARCSRNARHLNRGLHELGFDVVEPSPVTGAAGGEESIITPIVPVRVGEDWNAGLLWRALWDAGVFTNVAVHPAVPPGGALLRTSVMASHTPEVIDQALEAFARVKREVRSRARTAPRAPPLIVHRRTRARAEKPRSEQTSPY